jgi:hypothetical protein
MSRNHELQERDIFFSFFLRSLGCGKRPPGMRVIGGEIAVQNSWPWQISVALGQTHICGGSLISPKWVVTSAHCLVDIPFPSFYKVVAGSYILNVILNSILKYSKLFFSSYLLVWFLSFKAVTNSMEKLQSNRLSELKSCTYIRDSAPKH